MSNNRKTWSRPTRASTIIGSFRGPDLETGQDANSRTLDRNLTALLRRRNANNLKQHRRQSSVESMDKLYNTGRDEDDPDSRTSTESDGYGSLSTYGVTELRDSFFDAVFLPPEDVDPEELLEQAKLTLPLAFRKADPLSITNFFPKQWHDIKVVTRRVIETRSGIKLLKSFLGFFIAYVLCLVPSVRARLGAHSYIMVISAIVNHSGRTVGSQVEGLVLTTLGTLSGLGCGALGLWLSNITAAARSGFAGTLEAFLLVYIFLMACLRSYYIRTYQFVICSGIAMCYTCLAEVSSSEVSWTKLLAYGIPWVLGQAIALVPCLLVVPDAGARPLAVALHNAFGVMQEGLQTSQPRFLTARRRLAQTFVNLSQAYRDLVIEFSITLLDPKDVLQLRNLMQGTIRTLQSLTTKTRMFDDFTESGSDSSASNIRAGNPARVSGAEAVEEDSRREEELLKLVAERLVQPTRALLKAMRTSLHSCDAVLTDMCGHRQYLGPPPEVSDDVAGSLFTLRRKIIEFAEAQETVLDSEELPDTYANYPEIVKLFAYCRPVHQASVAVEALLVHVNVMQRRKPQRPRFYPPSYPFSKSLHRVNAQVRHDRGGLTAGSYFRSFSDIAKIIQGIKSKDFEPGSRRENHKGEEEIEVLYASMTATDLEDESKSKKSHLGHSIWTIMHRLQGFETRFGLKAALLVSLLAIPAWLTDSNQWWDQSTAWWAAVTAWQMTAPRVGGNLQDLFTRTSYAIVGAVWGGLAYAAGNGNPFVTAAFALLFMPPMIYRYTQSSHPRSGMVACMSFTVVSLTEYTAEGVFSPVIVAATCGGAIAVGVVASILMNWILWPFVARHDLRKAISMMIFYCSIVYRSIVSKYVYYETGREPTEEDIKSSERLEGRVREGFVRLRQLLGLTRHEIRLKAPFNPLPYSGLISACEQFFEYVVALRQASQFYHPHFIRDNPDAAARLIGFRRDSVATVLTNLYVLSGALRADRKVPVKLPESLMLPWIERYLPNAAAARQELMNEMKQLELELASSANASSGDKIENKKWSQIYSYSYNTSLTGCVDQLKELEKYTKAIVGEQGDPFAVGVSGENVTRYTCRRHGFFADLSRVKIQKT